MYGTLLLCVNKYLFLWPSLVIKLKLKHDVINLYHMSDSFITNTIIFYWNAITLNY